MHMAICVTEQMVDAAHRQLPGISNRMRVRHALEAAIATLPDSAEIDLPVTARIHLEIDTEQLRAETLAALERYKARHRTDEQGRLVLASYGAAIPPDEPHVTVDGLEGPGVTDPTGQTAATVNHPRILAGISEIATRLQAGRSTVVGWVKNAAANGMPAPLQTLAAGPVYDLEAVETWYRKWKDGSNAQR